MKIHNYHMTEMMSQFWEVGVTKIPTLHIIIIPIFVTTVVTVTDHYNY